MSAPALHSTVYLNHHHLSYVWCQYPYCFTPLCTLTPITMQRQEEDEFAPSNTPGSLFCFLIYERDLLLFFVDVGYKLGEKKTLDELAELDSEDASLARWKASLGVVPGAPSNASGPKVRVTT